MNETAQASRAEDAVDATRDMASSGAAPKPLPLPLLDRTGPLLALFLFVGLVVLIAAFLTVHSHRSDAWPGPETMWTPTIGTMLKNGGSLRSNLLLSHWLNEGYFHYFGLLVRTPAGSRVIIYRSSTGGYMVSAFILEKLYVTLFGHYSWRLVALHNQLVSLLLSALLGLLGYRVARRIGIDPRLAFAAGASVVIVVFTFPDNLALYWEMSPQACWLLFAAVFLVVEERCLDGRRRPAHSILQAAAAFLMTCMESIATLAFASAMAAMLLILEQRRGSWKRFFLLVIAPLLAVLALYGLQLYGVAKRFPDTEVSGSTFMERSGLDGESLYYGDHLDIARRRDSARNNWEWHHQYLFRWEWVFILGTISTMVLIAAYVAGRVPRIALEVLVTLAGAWLLYAAVFSQSVVIHPYYYDVILFTPLAIALFAFVPALAESLTRRTGAILLVIVLCAIWYALFQMRLYALRYPMPNTKVGAVGVARVAG